MDSTRANCATRGLGTTRSVGKSRFRYAIENLAVVGLAGRTHGHAALRHFELHLRDGSHRHGELRAENEPWRIGTWNGSTTFS